MGFESVVPLCERAPGDRRWQDSRPGEQSARPPALPQQAHVNRRELLPLVVVLSSLAKSPRVDLQSQPMAQRADCSRARCSSAWWGMSRPAAAAAMSAGVWSAQHRTRIAEEFHHLERNASDPSCVAHACCKASGVG